MDEQDSFNQQAEVRDPLEGILGILHDYAKIRPVTVEEMKAAVVAKAAEKYGGGGKPS
jgi:hypothetical protein